MTIQNFGQDGLLEQLLNRLADLRTPPDRLGTVSHGAERGLRVFGYCIQERERIARSCLEHPAVVIVLSGMKEVWRGEVVQRFKRGVPFVIPAGMPLDIVNVPDPTTGRYESICITVDASLRAALRDGVRGMPEHKGIPDSLAITLTADLVEAFGHAASALTDQSGKMAAPTARHRIVEILLLLWQTPVARMLVAVGRVEQVEAIIHADPARAWRVEEIARVLGVGASTLRRQLKDEDSSFRAILLSARMIAAGALLSRSGYSVTQAAQAAGYASRSHFARRIKATHGVIPSRLRHMKG